MDLGEVKKLDLSILIMPMPGCGVLVPLTYRILLGAKFKETNFLTKTMPLLSLHTLPSLLP